MAIWNRKKYDFTAQMIARRRQERDLAKQGFVQIDPTECGWLMFDELRQQGNRIEAVEISKDGTGLFVKLANEPRPQLAPQSWRDAISNAADNPYWNAIDLKRA